MGALASPLTQMDRSPVPAPVAPPPGALSAAPAGGGNPIVDEIDQAHAGLSPDAKQAMALAFPAMAPKLASPAALAAPAPTAAPTAPAPTSAMQESQRLAGSPSGIGGLHHAAARIPLQILDAIGTAFAPGLTAGIPGTQLHHDMLLRQAQGQAKEDTAQQEAAAREGLGGAQAGEAAGRNAREQESAPGAIAHTAAETGELGARAANEQSEATERGKPKPPANEFEKFITDTPSATDDDWEKFKAAHEKPVLAKDVTEKWIQEHPEGTAVELQDFLAKAPKTPTVPRWTAEDAALLRAAGGDPDKPETQTLPVMKAFRDLKTEKVPAIPADHGQNFVDPATGRLVRVEPNGVVPKGAVTAAGENAVNTPTMQQRTAAGRAGTVLDMAPEVLARIDSLSKELGPTMGRWNDFMQGKIGMDNPGFAGLRSDLLMMSSAVALAHAQGRLPENLREEFDKAINAPKQTPANLKETITTMLPWLKAVQGQGGAAGSVGAGADPAVKAYADKYFGGDTKKAQAAIDSQTKK
jgi:hypothetical protein